MKTCIACGMPMKNISEHAMNDESKNYCIHCAREDGSMQSFEEKVQGTTEFIIRTQGIDVTAAKSAAYEMLKKLPAWKGAFENE